MVSKAAGKVLCCLAFIILMLLQDRPVYGTYKFDGDTAYAHTKYLAETIGPRPPGSEAELKAAEYIAASLRQYGWEVKLQGFSRVNSVESGSIKKYSLINSRNVIAVKQGKLPDKIVLGAHYDSAGCDVPGAADNASGVGVLLELARELGRQFPDQGFVLVAFGAEEAGLVGSRYFAENYDLSQVKLMINLDMVGDGNKVALDGGGKISTTPELLRSAYEAVRKEGMKPEVRRDLMLLARGSREGGSSDFSPFLDKWIPAVGLGQGGQPPSIYHQPTDTMEHVNKQTLAAYGRIVLNLLNQSQRFSASEKWNYSYITFDFGFSLLFIPEKAVKAFVVFSVALALFWLFVKAAQDWFALLWVIPGIGILSSLAFFAGYLPEYLIGFVKGIKEPWFAHPGLYLVLHLSTTALILYWLSAFLWEFPAKAAPRKRETYWAGSLILLSTGTVAAAALRWDFALYFALWLFLTTLSGFKRGVLLTLTGPVLVYIFHWQVLNSHLWTEAYRMFKEHAFVFSLVYGFGLIPAILSLLACRVQNPAAWPRLSLKVAVAALLYITISVMIAPSYTTAYPRAVSVVEEWEEEALILKLSSKDFIPQALKQQAGIKKDSNQKTLPLGAHQQPISASIKTEKVTLNKEQLITVNANLNYYGDPYLLKLKLRSDKPFTLVNGGTFFPLGKLSKSVKLSGEPRGEVYGLILERSRPFAGAFQLYIRAEGKVKMTLEAEYPEQFHKAHYTLPKTLLKYENRWTITREI